MRGIPESTAEDWVALREQLRAARISPDMVDAVLLTSGINRNEAVAILRELLAEDLASIEDATVETKAQLAGLARIMASRLMKLHDAQGERSRTGTGRTSLVLWSMRLVVWAGKLSGYPDMGEDVGGDGLVQGIRIGAGPRRPRGRPKGSKTRRAGG